MPAENLESLKKIATTKPPPIDFYSPTQLSHILQCDALGGLNILQVKQNLSLTVCPFIEISFTLGGGLYVWESWFGVSERRKGKQNYVKLVSMKFDPR